MENFEKETIPKKKFLEGIWAYWGGNLKTCLGDLDL
jgi:hypothetical protein